MQISSDFICMAIIISPWGLAKFLFSDAQLSGNIGAALQNIEFITNYCDYNKCIILKK